MAGRGEVAPRHLRVYANHNTIVDFAEAESATPQLNISLLEGETGVTEYPLRTPAFANVHSLSLYFVRQPCSFADLEADLRLRAKPWKGIRSRSITSASGETANSNGERATRSLRFQRRMRQTRRFSIVSQRRRELSSQQHGRDVQAAKPNHYVVRNIVFRPSQRTPRLTIGHAHRRSNAFQVCDELRRTRGASPLIRIENNYIVKAMRSHRIPSGEGDVKLSSVRVSTSHAQD